MCQGLLKGRLCRLSAGRRYGESAGRRLRTHTTGSPALSPHKLPLVWLAALVLLGSQAAAAELDLSSPEAALRAALAVDAAGDREAAAQLLLPQYREQLRGGYGLGGQAWQFAQWWRRRFGPLISYEPGQVSQWGDLARGPVKITLPYEIGRGKRSIYVWLNLVHTQGLWLQDLDPKPALLKATADWGQAESEHFVYHFTRPGAVTEQHLRYHEEFLASVQKLMQVQAPPRIDYFLASNEREADLLGLMPWQYAGEGMLGTVVCNSPRFAHEVCHAMLPAQPPNNMLSEGLAVYLADNLDGFSGQVDFRAAAAKLLGEGKLLSLDQLAARDTRALSPSFEYVTEVVYTQAAAFVMYLIEQRGIEKFRQLFNEANIATFPAVFSRLYGQGLEQAEEEWRQWLGN